MTRDHLLVIDQGTTSTRAVVYDDQLQPTGQSQAELPPHYPQSGWVEHDPVALDQLGRSTGHRCIARCRAQNGSDRGHRVDQSAGDDDRLGTRYGASHRAGVGLARPSHGGDLRPSQGQSIVGCRANRPGDRPLLLGDQDRLDSRSRTGCSPTRRGRRTGRGHRRQLHDLAPDRRTSIRHGCHQRVTHASHGSENHKLGPRTLRTIRRSGPNITRDSTELGRIRPNPGTRLTCPTACRSWESPAISRHP